MLTSEQLKPITDLKGPFTCRMTDSIVNKWLLVRYLVIGVYVGVVTVAGFAWWYIFFEVSPEAAITAAELCCCCTSGCASVTAARTMHGKTGQSDCSTRR